MNQMWKRLFCASRHKKDKTIARLLFPSLLGIVLCGVCLAGTTWAWYSVSRQSGSAVLQSARYDMEVTVTAQTGQATQIRQNCFALDAYGNYTVTLRATGNASVGFGQILLDGRTYRTGPVVPGEAVTFTVNTGTQTAELTVIPVWGSQAGPAITDGTVLGESVPAPTELTPTEPVDQPTEPTHTEPVDQPTEPTHTEPVNQPTEPVSTELEEPPTEPALTEPAEQPAEPTPTEPTETAAD